MKLDLKEWIAKVTGQTEFKTLLWTNPSPTNTFAEQTVNINLSEYDAVDIVYKLFTNQQYNVTGQRVLMNDQTITVSASGSLAFFSGAIVLMARWASMSSSGVHFSTGSLGSVSASWAVDNRPLIPYKIYGIK
jgi:hypothetical protein